jgi:hypothetical protein
MEYYNENETELLFVGMESSMSGGCAYCLNLLTNVHTRMLTVYVF